MASWDEARSFLRSQFGLAKDSEQMVALAWRLPTEQGETVQWVRVSPSQVHGELWLSVLADICPKERLTPTTALAYLNQLPVGAILLWRDYFLFRHSLPLDRIAWPNLERTVRLVAHEALRLRLAVGAKESHAEALSHYDD